MTSKSIDLFSFRVIPNLLVALTQIPQGPALKNTDQEVELYVLHAA